MGYILATFAGRIKPTLKGGIETPLGLPFSPPDPKSCLQGFRPVLSNPLSCRSSYREAHLQRPLALQSLSQKSFFEYPPPHLGPKAQAAFKGEILSSFLLAVLDASHKSIER